MELEGLSHVSEVSEQPRLPLGPNQLSYLSGEILNSPDDHQSERRSQGHHSENIPKQAYQTSQHDNLSNKGLAGIETSHSLLQPLRELNDIRNLNQTSDGSNQPISLLLADLQAPSLSPLPNRAFPLKLRVQPANGFWEDPNPPPEAPVTLIISQSIASQESDGSTSAPPRRKYNVNRDNIKINKRIMRKDTFDVIKMFKRFDQEVLANPDAKARLLSLGFETRKRYITTFKHFIRFCCANNFDDFKVTGERMRDFYVDQVAKSTSPQPLIRLRKMDPAFSKLQEINFLVYKLHNKEIPNRSVALDFLASMEATAPPRTHKKSNSRAISPTDSNVSSDGESTGRESLVGPIPSISKSGLRLDSTITPAATPITLPLSPLSNCHVPLRELDEESTMKRAKISKSDEYSAFVKSQLKQLCKQIDSVVQKRCSNNPELMEAIRFDLNSNLHQFCLEVQNGPSENSVASADAVPTILMNHDIYTIYEILEEWYKVEPTIESRIKNWGFDWFRDDIDRETFADRQQIVEFVSQVCEECGETDQYLFANDCDRYIRDKSILDEFISEIELDKEDLKKRILRYRKKRLTTKVKKIE